MDGIADVGSVMGRVTTCADAATVRTPGVVQSPTGNDHEH
jgi:hypothetical protein